MSSTYSLRWNKMKITFVLIGLFFLRSNLVFYPLDHVKNKVIKTNKKIILG